MIRPLRTFIVEDSPVIRENLIATLEEMLPLTVVGIAEDEAAAVRWLADPANACDLGIIDIFLKHGTGLGVLKAARAARRGARLVVLSNYATVDLRQACLLLGADAVFDKSRDIEALLGYCAALAQAEEVKPIEQDEPTEARAPASTPPAAAGGVTG